MPKLGSFRQLAFATIEQYFFKQIDILVLNYIENNISENGTI